MALRNTKKRIAVGLGVLAAVGVSGAGVAIASGDDDASDTAITGSSLARATEAALAETGGGRVTGTEVDDEESKYEVEVTLGDGRQVDVQLDEDFRVVETESEHTEGDDG
ncbi:PepSY domain-containing protein [Promicromonospora soli]|uniref:YpeB-like protein with protease inhibitory function n=1 Tax=Promicromonospora soli TaxID=2035533 RepID=A0A919G2P7_9MICO|nr:PepSY domain-containing protein [Promicromonospora soli]GHH77107.1 hypothetical protein GCM10017772_37250 [Promicromonospora soli]